jgi:hypothetical protein
MAAPRARWPRRLRQQLGGATPGSVCGLGGPGGSPSPLSSHATHAAHLLTLTTAAAGSGPAFQDRRCTRSCQPGRTRRGNSDRVHDTPRTTRAFSTPPARPLRPLPMAAQPGPRDGSCSGSAALGRAGWPAQATAPGWQHRLCALSPQRQTADGRRAATLAGRVLLVLAVLGVLVSGGGDGRAAWRRGYRGRGYDRLRTANNGRWGGGRTRRMFHAMFLCRIHAASMQRLPVHMSRPSRRPDDSRSGIAHSPNTARMQQGRGDAGSSSRNSLLRATAPPANGRPCTRLPCLVGKGTAAPATEAGRSSPPAGVRACSWPAVTDGQAPGPVGPGWLANDAPQCHRHDRPPPRASPIPPSLKQSRPIPELEQGPPPHVTVPSSGFLLAGGPWRLGLGDVRSILCAPREG